LIKIRLNYALLINDYFQVAPLAEEYDL